MNIDKFGHNIHKRLRLSEYLDTLNDTLVKCENGHYDLKSTKLKGLTSPSDEDEAVNKAYVDKTTQELRNDIKKTFSDIKIYLEHSEKSISDRLTELFYTKREIDNLIKNKLNTK